MRPLFRFPLAFGLLLLLAPLALAAPAMVANSGLGKVLVNAKGMTLYTFAMDAKGKSACNGVCAEKWPPLMATGGAASGNWSVVTRSGGARQWAYKGRPLYTWTGDTKPGDTTGNGFLNGAWSVARP